MFAKVISKVMAYMGMIQPHDRVNDLVELHGIPVEA